MDISISLPPTSTILKISMMDIHCKSDLAMTLNMLQDRRNETTKLSICGPEYDAMGIGYEQSEDGDTYCGEPEIESVPDAHVEQVFKVISTLPALREIVIDPGHYSEDEGSLESSRVCWLLSSKDCRVETLRICDLDVRHQADVEKLALAFSTATSIKTLCIDKILIGYRGVKTLVPLMEALAQMPRLKKLRLVFDAYGATGVTNRHAQESLPVLKKSAGIENVQLKVNRTSRNAELINCGGLDAMI